MACRDFVCPSLPSPAPVQVVDALVERYRTVGPLLIKVEELVAGTATGKSPRLTGWVAVKAPGAGERCCRRWLTGWLL